MLPAALRCDNLLFVVGETALSPLRFYLAGTAYMRLFFVKLGFEAIITEL
jgi:hypothetical protein